MSDTDRKPKKVDILIINDEAETPSFLNPMSGQIFVTNPVGKRLMELADGSRNLQQIAHDLSVDFKGATQEHMLVEAETFFEESVRKGLATWIT